MIFIRHGQSSWNVPFGAWRIDAGIPDPELTDTGREQAKEAAASLGEKGISRLITSPYRRTLETAEIIASMLGVDMTIDPLVRERCAFSCDQGSSPKKLAQRWRGIDFSELDDVWWGGSIESAQGIQQRCREFHQKTVNLADRDRIAVVSHWGFIRTATGRMVENAEIVGWPGLGPDGELPPQGAI